MIGRVVAALVGFLFAVALYLGLHAAFVQPANDASAKALDTCRPRSSKGLTDPATQASIIDCYHSHGGSGTLHFVTEIRIAPKS